MRGAGCTINDFWDRNIDKHVARTRNRPLAAGLVSPKEAIVFLGAQLSVGLAVLVQFNLYTITLGALSLIPVAIYPLMKRITNWPQAFLGLTFNWGALVGWSAIAGVCNWTVVLPLYASNIMWTLCYDSIYALQDRKCDEKIGVKSSALAIKGKTKAYLSGFAASHLALLGLAGYLNGQMLPFYAISIGGSALHYIWQIWRLNEFNPVDAFAKFKSNTYLGLIVLLGVYADIIYKQKRSLKIEKDSTKDEE
jgi:4-hydroxybenzoate polyprenyltransferase